MIAVPRKTVLIILFLRDRCVGENGDAAKALWVTNRFGPRQHLISKIEVCCNEYNLGSLRTFIKGDDTVGGIFSPYVVFKGKRKDGFYLSILSSGITRA